MKILGLDIECSPNLATIWGIWKQNIGINQLHETSRILCYAGKWYKKDEYDASGNLINDSETIFDSEHKTEHKTMISRLWELLDSADVVYHYNGNRFDMPLINREFLKYGLTPPSPYKNMDLLLTIRKKFKFISNKLDHISNELSIGKKLETGGHQLWLDCMAGKEEAWQQMEIYNKQDVILLEKVYKKILPWIDNHPNYALYTDLTNITVPVCPNCGGTNLIKRGFEHLRTQTYQRYCCKDCGSWTRGRNTIVQKSSKPLILTQSTII